MFIEITGKNFNPSDKLEATIEKKFGKLDKYFSSEAKAAIMCSEVKTGLCKLEATIYAAGMIFRAEESSSDMYASIDLVQESIVKQLRRHKSKLIDRYQSGFTPTYTEEDVEDEDAIRIVRTKHFALKPMDPEEACLQMELLGHSFYVFRDSMTEQVCVVYKRKDGAYGLIEPEG